MPLQCKTDRFQIRFLSFEDQISPDNSVRFIDAFVDKLELNKLEFAAQTIKTEGRPAFE